VRSNHGLAVQKLQAGRWSCKPIRPVRALCASWVLWTLAHPDRPTYPCRPSILEYGSPPLMRTASDGAQLLSSTGRPPLPRRRSADDGDAAEVRQTYLARCPWDGYHQPHSTAADNDSPKVRGHALLAHLAYSPPHLQEEAVQPAWPSACHSV